MRGGVKSAISSAVILGAELGFVAYMVGHMPSIGALSRSIPAQHPIAFGVFVAIVTLIVGLLCVKFFGESTPQPKPPRPQSTTIAQRRMPGKLS